MRSAAVMALLVLLGLSSSAWAKRGVGIAGDFPYCSCYVPRESAFSVSYPSARPVAKGIRYCFDISAYRQPGKCGSFDLKKVEMDIAPQCAAVTDVTFNNRPYAASYTRYPGAVPKTVFKVTGGSSPLATFSSVETEGAALCFTVPQQCPLTTFCRGGKCEFAFFDVSKKCCPTTSFGYPTPSPSPSPYPSPSPSPAPSPSPPIITIPPPGFPYCDCNKKVQSAYTLELISYATYLDDVSMCFNLNATTVASTSSCANRDLRKIEIEINNECYGAVRSLSVGNVQIAPSYATPKDKHGQHTILKITKRNSSTNPLVTLSQAQSEPIRVCMHVSGSKCDSVEKLCKNGNCWAAFFAAGAGGLKCCPISSVVY